MAAIQDGILAFFAATGAAAVVWLAAGVLLRTGRPAIPGLLLALPLRGDAPAMEQDVRELRRVLHQIPGSHLVLVDCGMTEDARRLAAYLAEREDGGTLVSAERFRVE